MRNDGIGVREAPDEETMTAVQIAVAGSGSITDRTTTLAIPRGRLGGIPGRAGERAKARSPAGRAGRAGACG